MILTDLQIHMSKRAQNESYTFLCWNREMGKTVVCMHALIERCLEIRGLSAIYVYPNAEDRMYSLDFAVQTLEKLFKMNAQVTQNSLRFGNGSKISLMSANEYIMQPNNYDFIVLDDTHKIDCASDLYMELFRRAEGRPERGREELRHVLEARLKGA